MRDMRLTVSAYDNWEKYQKKMEERFGITIANAKRYGTEKGEPKSK
jgi:hypothetical protein